MISFSSWIKNAGDILNIAQGDSHEQWHRVRTLDPIA
jgi:hypothetical protein